MRLHDQLNRGPLEAVPALSAVGVAAARQDATICGQSDLQIVWAPGVAGTGAQVSRVLAAVGTIPELAHWQAAWAHLLTRHALLSSFFVVDAGHAHWRRMNADEFAAAAQIAFDHCDSPASARECVATRAREPVLSTNYPAARAGLVNVKEGDSEALFWFTLHPAITDFVSAQIVQDELYAILLGLVPPPLPDPVVVANQWTADLAQRDYDWWRDHLEHLMTEGAEEAFEGLATDSASDTRSGEPAEPLTERLDQVAVAALEDLARTRAISFHSLLLTLLGIEMRRRTGRAHVVVGSADSIRPPGLERAVGSFNNLLPIALSAMRGSSLAEQARASHAAIGQAVEHSRCPCSLIDQAFRQRHPDSRPRSSTSLFDVSLTAIPFNPSANASAAFRLTPLRTPADASALPTGVALAFSYQPLEDESNGLELSLVWDGAGFSRATAQAWLRGVAAWAGWLAEDSRRADFPVPALLPEERRCLAQWENGPIISRPARRFHELFELVADRQPQSPAVISEAGVESYAELDRHANRIARCLLDHGIGPEEPVAVLTECSASLPASVLGIWKAGAAYLPLALDYPPDRLAFIARDAGARILISLDDNPAPSILAQAVHTILRPKDWQHNAGRLRPQVSGTPQDLAFIIYTSGTSGVPKGVLIQHDSLINAALMTDEACGLTSRDRVSLAATPGFDASLWELSIGLPHGIAIVPVPRSLRDDPWALKRYYKAQGVTVAFHTPSYLRVSQETPFDGMRVLITGGEAPNHNDARRHAGSLALYNAYGPTETCIFVCAERISPNPDADRPLAVGRPLANTRISIRGSHGDPAPPGVLGEVWLGGAGLARGYLNNPELTEERFVTTSEGRFYRSGDLGRWTEDGRLELAGRIDDQIKLHGQRVEPGEIEQALQSHRSVEAAVALPEAAAEGTRILRAFVRLRPEAVPLLDDEWRDYLAGRLPAHMIPASVTSVAAIPLNASGKVHRDALLAIAKASSDASPKNLPRGDMETRVAGVWMDLLRPAGAISRDDNFFALGGNSLLAVTMAHRLSGELDRTIPARELFAAPTLAAFTQRIERLNDASSPIPASTNLATEGQCEFRVAEAAGLDTRTFTIRVLRVVEGAMPSLDRWRRAWGDLVARHQALRTSFSEDAEGQLYRVVEPDLIDSLETATLPDPRAARAFIRQRQDELFIMGLPPLWRGGLVEVEESGEHLFWLALHHSIADGRSVAIITDELGALLRGENLPPLTSEFAESAAREHEYLGGPACAADASYWRDLLLRQPEQTFTEGPLDFSRSLTARPGNHRFEACLDDVTTRGLLEIARQHEASLHAVMLTLLSFEARRRMGREDVMIGATASTRETAAEEHVVGYFVNMLPIPFHIPRSLTFGAALRETQQGLASGLQHARYPFARMYRDYWSERPQHRDAARYPLFDLVVTEVPQSGSTPALPRLASLSSPAYELTDASPGEDMVLAHEALDDGGLRLQWHVNAAVYTRETAEAWFAALMAWARWLAENGARAQESWPALLPSEETLLQSWEYGTAVSRPALRFHELFENVLDAPGQAGRPAVISKALTLTYGALEREANAIAHALLQRGAGVGSVVGVLTGRSVNLPAAVLGIWKAGATYLPLAVELPPDRLAFVARDAGISHLIALDGLVVPTALPTALPPAFRPEELDTSFRRSHAHRPPHSENAGSAAYIIYTSGSTGQPKGTVIGHEAYVNAVMGTGEACGLTHRDRTLLFASPAFDVSLSDIGLPLAFGAALCPVAIDVISSPNRFRAFLSEFAVTVADLTPTYLRLFDGADLPSLRILVTGGEAPFRADVDAYSGRIAYFNAYGPTENTITSMLARLRPGGHGVLSCGRPLPNTSVHVCDTHGDPVPPAVTGEVWLGGAGLAHGYLGRPELTGMAFVETDRGRRYRSGDLGRWSSSGEMEILGRIDEQVKLNGIRVELGEIEHTMASHPDVAQAVALLDGDREGQRRLWVFARPIAGKPPQAELWRAYLADRLPAYMAPAAVIAVDDIPLSHAGKIDKAALKSRLNGWSTTADKSAPQGATEAVIARVWSELLGQDSIHREDNFFSLGGHSLLAIAAAHRLEEALGCPVRAREVFAEPTLRGFAQRVDRLRDMDPVDDVWSDRATEGQREFWVAERAGLDTRSFNMSMTLLARDKAPSEARWRKAWAALIARHDALRTRFHEDEEGVLRRSALLDVGTGLEVDTFADTSCALAYVEERAAEPFAMTSAPLWRAGLARVAATDQSVFWLVLHHSIGDGVSLSVLVEELSTLLDDGTLPPLTAHFDQAAGRELRYLASPACQEDAHYWRTVLAGLADGADETHQPFDEWPLDYPRPLGRTEGNARGAHSFHVRLDAATAAGLRDFAQRNGASLHALMLTILAQEVRRRTGRPGFLLGSLASTRESGREARVVGYYVNLTPVPCQVHRHESVEQALRNMQRNLADGQQHARYPFARIYSDHRQSSTVAPHPARYPLFDLAVTENLGAADAALRSVAHTMGYEHRRNAPAQDMLLAHEGRDDGSLFLHWHVNAAIYEKETAEAWIESLAGWARFLCSRDRVPESPLPALLPREEEVLSSWEHGPALPPRAPSFPARFEQWAHVAPDCPALITEQGAQSYAEVNARSNALAHALLARVARQEVIGVFTDRSTVLPETVLAIWKAGACYLPLVKDLPGDRLAFIARDAGIRLVVVLDGLEPPPSLVEAGCEIFRPESLGVDYLSSHSHAVSQVDGVAGSDRAYIIYTSGSTGVPKGVILLHRGLNNLGVGVEATLQTRSADRVSMMASPTFDAWIADLVMAWAVGGAVVPVLRGEMDNPIELCAKFMRLGVTVSTMPPSYLRLFGQEDFPGLRLLITAGEPPHPADAAHYARRLRYMNGYGPTENTVAVSFGHLHHRARRLTAGKPLANTCVRILGNEGEPVPPGAVGMIWLGGMQLASEYLNRPDLTAASFVETAGGRLYRTGDLGRWTHTGELEVLGRFDGQVKLRGHRIELGEIEHWMGSYPGVRQVVAILDDHGQTLRAFVCMNPGAAEPTQAAWQDYLAAALPAYMLPASVTRVPAIPVTTAGKVDRAELLRLLTGSGRLTTRRGSAPREGLEQRIAQVWTEHLRCEFVAREDHFFDLGGNSLRAIATINELRRTCECTVNDLYEHPRLMDFAAACQPRAEHLWTLLRSARGHWRQYRREIAGYDAERDAALRSAYDVYDARNRSYLQGTAGKRRDYQRILLTGATGYLGSYVLRELLTGSPRQVDVLVRGCDEREARVRLGQTLCHYFGPKRGAALRDDPRVTVLAGDLRRDDLGLPSRVYDSLANRVQAVIHCAANVKHFGHYQEFHADNVCGTGRLLKLAARHSSNPADFHLVSTLSVCGKAPKDTFRLFTEYDGIPELLDENYYIRSKQEAERLVVRARGDLANASIHRVGNVVFAAEGGALQFNIQENAFFRQVAAFLSLGVAPEDAHLWLCHVDVVARGLVLLAGAADLTNQTHHLENARRDTLADFLTTVGSVRACSFDDFLERLESAVNDPGMSAALAATLETFRLYEGISPQERGRRLEIVSARTQSLLAREGVTWPSLPETGHMEMLGQAARLFPQPLTMRASR